MKSFLLPPAFARVTKQISVFLLVTLISCVLSAQVTQWKTCIGGKKVFIENKGQFNGKNNLKGTDILFGTENGPSQLFFTKTGVTYSLSKRTPKYDKDKEAREKDRKNFAEKEKEEHELTISKDFVQMEWVNANPNVKVIGTEKASGYQNFVLNKKPLPAAQCFKKLVYQNLYPGIDVEYVFHETEGVEYSFIIHPGADASQIKMKYSDVSRVGADENGNLHLPTRFGDIVDHAPKTFYQGDNKSIIASSFIKSGKVVGFQLGDYDHGKTVVLDPWTVTPAMPNSNRVFQIETDSSGNVYIYGGDSPFLLEKYNSSGTWQWTFNTGWDSSSVWMGSLITDPSGNSIITAGSTAAITKVNTAGTQVWTANGGANDEYWGLAFNCDFSQLIVGGTRLTFAGITPNGSGRIYNINPANGSVISNVYLGANLPGTFFSDVNEVRAISSSPNGNYYYLTLDTVGSVTANLAVRYAALSTYRYAYGSPSYGFTPQGQNTLKASANALYSMDGANLHKRDINTGTIVTTVAIPGGGVVTSPFVQGSAAKNGGIAIDSCGNVYVGSVNEVVKYDANLTQLSTAVTPNAVYDVAVSTNGNIVASGNGFAMAINMSACRTIKPICVTVLSSTATQTNPQCPGQCNGSATANAVNGTGPYQYLWSGGQTTQTVSNLCPGSYIVTITDVATSATSSSSVNITQPGAFTATASNTAANCGSSNGTATANVTAGTGPYTYAWSNNGTGQTISSLPAGSYIVTVTGANGCSTTAATTVTSTGSLTITPSATATTCGFSNGSASVSVGTGTGPFTYSWGNGSTTASLSNLAAGSYPVTVSSSGGCSATASAVVSSSTGITLSSFGGRSGCISSGTASVSVLSGTGPFTYAWSNSATTANISSLAPGNYSVTVTGAAGCSASASVTVLSTGTGVTLSASFTASSCSSNSGSASVTATTGDSPFTYVWSNSATTATISNIAGGTYTVTVTGSTGCSATASVSVTASGSLGVTASATNATCGSSTGTASANVSGSGTYTYLWNNSATTDTINNLAAGTYTVTVTGGGGCSGTASAVVNPSGGTVNIQAQSTSFCQGDSSQICAPAGYTVYHWNTGVTTRCITATQSGNYYVTVTDNSNCTATSNHVAITVNVPAQVTLTQHNDTLKASGGVSYQWYINGSPISGATSSSYYPNVAGTYYVESTDANGCISKSNSTVIKIPLGIDQVSAESEIKVYPNPLANGAWHLKVGNEWIGSQCEFYDAAGRLIYKTELRNNDTEFNLAIAQGVYLLRVNSNFKNYAVKLIKL